MMGSPHIAWGNCHLIESPSRSWRISFQEGSSPRPQGYEGCELEASIPGSVGLCPGGLSVLTAWQLASPLSE